MDWITIFIRLSSIFIISGLIGYDREYKNRPAGIRTHILVGLGASIVALTQLAINEASILQIMGSEVLQNVIKIDNSRLVAQVISGIGFLGAGTIIVNKGSVTGLTTAASLWTVATLGLAFGFGFFKLGLLSSFFVFLTLVVVTKVVRLTHLKRFKVTGTNFKVTQAFIDQLFHSENVTVEKSQFKFSKMNDGVYSVIYTVILPQNILLELIYFKLREYQDIIKVENQ